MREKIAKEFYIEDHAFLYGILVKNSIKVCGVLGEEASKNGTILYAKERGTRMALRASLDKQELTPNNYMIYGEWSDYKKVGSSEVKSISPEYRTNSLICGWCETWKKYDLIEYGKLYCTWIDKTLVKAFNPNNILEIDSLLSYGDNCCAFHWVGAKFKDMEDLKQLREEKASKAHYVLKDFLYHTAHLLSAMTRQFYMDLGVIKTNEIINSTLLEYEKEFGLEKKKALIEEAKLNFMLV